MWNPNKSSISPASRKRRSPHFKHIEVSSWFCWCEVLQNYSDTACHRKMKFVLMFQRALEQFGAMFTWCHGQTDKTAECLIMQQYNPKISGVAFTFGKYFTRRMQNLGSLQTQLHARQLHNEVSHCRACLRTEARSLDCSSLHN